MCAIQIDSVITKAHNFSALEILCFFFAENEEQLSGEDKINFFFQIAKNICRKVQHTLILLKLFCNSLLHFGTIL